MFFTAGLEKCMLMPLPFLMLRPVNLPDSSEPPARFHSGHFFNIFRDALANRYLPNFKDDYHKEIDYFRPVHTLLRPGQFPAL